MRLLRIGVAAAALCCLTIGPVKAQDALTGEVAALVDSMNRLVQVLESRERDRAGDDDLRRIGLAVQILDIRTRQHEALQKELRNLEDAEQRTIAYIASREIRLKNAKKQMLEAKDEATRLEHEIDRDEILVSIDNYRKRLEHYAGRRSELESRIIDGERLTLDVEAVVDGWLTELGDR